VEYGIRLPMLVRRAVRLGKVALARRLVRPSTATLPAQEHATRDAAAHVAQAAGDHEEAARQFADAAERWASFGNHPEQA
jgi:hypothetical protein